MKVLIWFVCLMVPAFIQTYEAKSGNYMGGIPVLIMYSIFLGLAKYLCDKWTDYSCYRADKELQAARAEYIAANISSDIVSKCEAYKGNKVALKTYLETIVSEEKITQKQSDDLYRHFTEAEIR